MNIGERIGDYEILDVLGAGGMGEVYKVRNVISERVEAMKLLLPDLSAKDELVSRFMREIRVLAALEHPNIAHLYTAQVLDGKILMLMEFVEGLSLDKVLKQGSPAMSNSIDYAVQVLAALAYAHLRGVVHRDVKPANVILMPGGAIKLVDFGIARMKADSRALTRTGQVVGSLLYMSPEQIKGGEPDARSDIYSTGVMLYEMVAGRRPFNGDSEYSIMAAHLYEVPDAPMGFAAGIPEGLSNAILKALAKDPSERFQTADEFAEALQATAPVLGARLNSAAAVQNPRVGRRAMALSPRARWMALGSAVTLMVLVAGLIEGPKFLGEVSAGRTGSLKIGSETSGSVAEKQGNQARSTGSRRDGSKERKGRAGFGLPREQAQKGKATVLDPRPQNIGSTQQTSSPAAAGPPKDLRDQLDKVEAEIKTTQGELDSLRLPGLGLAPALTKAQNTAQIKLARATDDMAAGAYADARDSLDEAEQALQTIQEQLYGR